MYPGFSLCSVSVSVLYNPVHKDISDERIAHSFLCNIRIVLKINISTCVFRAIVQELATMGFIKKGHVKKFKLLLKKLV